MGVEILFERARNMRINPTPAEKTLRERLINKRIGFHNQRVIGRYIVDFLIGKTIIELDGSSHNGREEYDAERDKFLRSKGYRVLRFHNSEAATLSLKGFKATERKKSGKVPKNCKSFDYRQAAKGVSSKSPKFKKLPWNAQKIVLQRERLHGQ